MSPTETHHDAEVAALKERVAYLEARLAEGAGFSSGLHSVDQFVRRHLHGVGVGVALFTRDWKQATYVSLTVENILGFSRQDLQADPRVWLAQVDLEDRPSVLRAFDQAVGTEEAIHVNYRLKRGGDTRWIRSRFVGIAGEGADVAIVFEDVTERHRIEEALHESEAKYRRIVETANEGILLTDLDWRITFVNEPVTKFFGLPAEQIIDRNVFELIHPDDRTHAQSALTRHERGTKKTYQTKFRLVDGSESWLTVTTGPVFDDAGHVAGSLVMISDVTERVRAEQAVRASEQRLRRVLDATSEGVWEWNVPNGDVFYSPRWHESLGYTPAEIIPHVSFCHRRVHPEDWPRVEARLQEHFAGRGEFYECEYRLRTRAGYWRWTHARGKVVKRNAEGEPELMIGVDVDIDQRKRVEQSLHESERRFRALAVHSPMGIFQTDAAGHLQFANDRYCSIAGISPREALGMGWLRTVHPEDRERVLSCWHDALQTQTEFSQEYRFLHDDGDVRWAMGTAVPLRGEQGGVALYLGNVLDITRRKAAEEALKASEQRFRLLSSCSPIGIFLADEQGQIIYVNPGLKAICGYEPEELTGQGFLRVFRPQDRQQGLRNWLAIARSAAPHDVERRFLNQNGQMRWVHLRSVPVVSPTGAVLGRVGTVEDITDRRLAESELRNNEERYRILAEHATDMISRHTPDGTYLYASPACESLLGYTPEELLGRNAYDLFHPEDLAAIRESHASAAEPLRIANVAYRVCRKDGHYIWVETTAKSFVDPGSGRVGEIVAVSRDITVRRQAAEQLRASEARMRSILDTASDGILAINEAGIIEAFNPGAERLFGYQADEALGQHIRLLMPEEFDVAGGAGLSRDLRQPTARVREVLGRRKDGGACELEMRLGETVIGGRSIFTGILHDISERNRTEKMWRESEKLAATGRIAARIAHEINNPLAGIKNSFLLIKDAIPRSHAYFSYVARIESEIDRIARIVRQMFDLYRPDHVILRESALGDTIRDVVALLSTTAPGSQVKLEVDTTRVAGPVRLPEDSVRQVLYNVIVNAIEASPPGGTVGVAASLADDTVEVLVSDQGAGIASGLRSQIYEPFFTTKSERAAGGLGLGLGLSISRGIVEAMQGTLDFESMAGGGTVFRIRIPTGEQSEPTND